MCSQKGEMPMKEFVLGTDAQYEMLKQSLNDDRCHVYERCIFPSSFSRPSGRIGFEKEQVGYALFIDKGLTCSCPVASRLLKSWLKAGTLKFLDYTDMKVFLRSLTYLY
jgi:hypothetical protein